MTGTEWTELVVECEKRWPNFWTKEQAVAYYQDIRDFDAIDVWSAWHLLYSQGRDTPPNGSMLQAVARQEARRSRDTGYHRLELPDPDTVTVWETYSQQTYGRVVSMQQAIRTEHAKLPADQCAGLRSYNRHCDIHKTKED
jgi:hypothetical protein